MSQVTRRASVQYGDYKGTVSVDEADPNKDRFLDVFGLEKGWFILGIHCYGGGELGLWGTYLRVWAIPSSRFMGEDRPSLPELLEQERPLDVTEFIYDAGDTPELEAPPEAIPDALSILIRGSKRFSLALWCRTVVESDLDQAKDFQVVEERRMIWRDGAWVETDE